MNKFPKIGLLALSVLASLSVTAQNTFPATGNVGIGTTTPAYVLSMESSGTTGANHTIRAAAFTSTAGATVSGGFNFTRARGTKTAPTTVVNGDRLNVVTAAGYDGAAYQFGSAIGFFVDGVVTAGVVPSNIIFETGTTGTTRLPRLTIASSGTVRVHNLSGTGTRMVVADANGILSTQTIPTGGGGSTYDFWLTTAGALPDGTTDNTETVRRMGDVGIGIAAPDHARLHVADNLGATDRYAILGEQTGENPDSTLVGVGGYSTGVGGTRIGVDAYASSDSLGVGVWSSGSDFAEVNVGDVYTSGTLTVIDAAGVADQTAYFENTSDSNVSGYDFIGSVSFAYGGTSWGIGAYNDGGWIGTYGVAVDSFNVDFWQAGGYFIGRNLGSTATQSAYGVRGSAAIDISGSTTMAAYGVWGSATAGASATATNAWAVYSNGRAYSTSGTWSGSDARLKTNVKNVGNAMSIISRLQPKTYEYRHDGKFAQCNFAGGTQYGFLAQDLEQVIPEMVTDVQMPFNSEDEDKTNDFTETYKAVNYDALIPVLTKGIQEQQEVIEKQNETITTLQNEIAAIKAALSQAGVQLPQSGTVGATGTETQLFQNVPNPFDGTTTIPYFINQNATSAKVVITNAATGQVAQTFEVATKGAGQLRVSAAGMSSGTYTYSLIVDGQVVASKAMVLTK